ncbi:Pol protein [Phytophthora cinnamomi]|uniref:Pol protein n=1 Tax=Phytophthora cinnamomi TaxID=4785 RepID=UPI0035598A3C|nr:Pol protein [Phytophthora cinnamomi]
MDEDAPTSSPSSSVSRSRTSTSGSGAASLPSHRNLGNAFNLANESDSEYKAAEIECSDNDEGGAVDGDADEGDADETELNHSVYRDYPNIVRPGEKPEDFVRLDSDDENDVNSVYDDDDDLGPTEPVAEDSGTALDLHFQPSLPGAVGGVAEIARGNVSKNVLSGIKFNGWSEPRGSGEQDRVVRRDPQTAKEAELMAPIVVKDYQTYMGGVDVHDQLRLQRYSLQMARRYMKYHRSLFLGLIDLAIINAFLLYNERRVVDGKPKASHVEFLKRLHLELIQLREEDWDQHSFGNAAYSRPPRSDANLQPVTSPSRRMSGGKLPTLV